MNSYKIHEDVRIGHVHLRVADLERANAFYRDVLGFTLVINGPAFGLPATFLAAGSYHHHVALNTFESAGGTPPPKGHTGLYHLAILYPNRATLAHAIQRLFACGYPIDHGKDHGATLSVYLRDPDGNGIELYYDRPSTPWIDDRGQPLVRNEPFDVRDLLDESRHAGVELALQ